MSIIHDALKKVQRNLNPGQVSKSRPREAAPAGSQETARRTAEPQKIPNPRPAQNLSRLVPDPAAVTAAVRKKIRSLTVPAHFWTVLGGIACAGLMAVLLLLSRFLAQTHEKPADPFEGVIVKGVMTHEDKNFVLINDGIYEIGEMAEGFRIVGISLNSIQVLKDGKLHSLKIQNNKKPSMSQ